MKKESMTEFCCHSHSQLFFAQCYEHAYVSPVPFDTPLGYHGRRTRAAGKGDVSHVTVASCRFVQSLIT